MNFDRCSREWARSERGRLMKRCRWTVNSSHTLLVVALPPSKPSDPPPPPSVGVREATLTLLLQLSGSVRTCSAGKRQQQADHQHEDISLHNHSKCKWKIKNKSFQRQYVEVNPSTVQSVRSAVIFIPWECDKTMKAE